MQWPLTLTCLFKVIKSPQSGVTMFSVRFRRVHRRNYFCLSHQNRWTKPLDTWHKEYMGLGKCTGWPLHDLDPRSRLWHRLAKICLSARLSENHSSDHYKTWQLYCSSHGYYLIRFWRSSVWNFYFGKFSLKILDVSFQGQTLFWPYLRNGWSDWCEIERKCIGWILGTICYLDLWPHSWPWPWIFQGQIWKWLISQELLVWLMWNENKVS